MMLAFKGMLECLIFFENFRRNKDGKQETTTVIAVDKAGAQIKHVDNGSTNTTWQTVACFILNGFLNKVETKPATTPTSTTDDNIKEATTPAEDDIKQDAASASFSASSTAETSEMLN